jgi:hypothetical protein
MTTVSQIIGQPRYNAGSVAPSGGTTDGYSSLTGSVVRNTLIGAATGAIIGAPTGIGIPIGAGVGAVVGAGSALIRNPNVASAVGDGMKGAMAGAAGGALVGGLTPLTPIGGAIAGAAGGFLTGLTSHLLDKITGGRTAITKETTVWGRLAKGFAMGAVSGAAVGAGAGALFGGIGAIPGAISGLLIGGVGGAIYGVTTGVTDAATGAKGATFFGGKSGGLLPSITDKFNHGSGSTQQYVDQGRPSQSTNQQSVVQYAA